MVSWTWVNQKIRLENCSVWACGGDMKRLQAYMKYMDFKHRFQFKNMNSLDLATQSYYYSLKFHSVVGRC